MIASSKDGSFHSGFLRSASGNPVTNISRTSVAIWNHQGDTVRGADIVPDDRLRIQLDDGDHALQARAASRSRLQNKLNVTVDSVNDRMIYVDFDFLDAGDGGVIEVIHHGPAEPRVLGTIRGADLGVRRKADLRPEVLEGATKAWWIRMKRLPLRLRLFPLVSIAVYLLIAILVSWYVFSRSAQTVDAANYDLKSLIGQREFAQEVNRVGLPSFVGVWAAIGGTVLLTLAYIMLFRERIKITFPRSIVKILELGQKEVKIESDPSALGGYASGKPDAMQS